MRRRRKMRRRRRLSRLVGVGGSAAGGAALALEQRVNEFLQRCKFPLFHQREFQDEKEKVLEGRVEVSLFAQCDNLGKVVVVNVAVDAEQPLKDVLDDQQEIFGERLANLGRKDLLVVKETLHPDHQIINIFRRSTLDGCRYLGPVRPVVLVLGPRAHYRALLRRTKLSNSPIQHVNLIKKINGIHRKPFVQIFTLGQRNGKAQVATAQRRFRVRCQ
mmetsp:Transcript_6905/g.22173  ORF Transcript_6905/g.22173 Transcript_6905/m.22173 type:complete len:217 (+) Transcript_6905:523-1173(+)